MASVFLILEIEDATIESMIAALPYVTPGLESKVREALGVPEAKRVMLEPFRNGVVLQIAYAQFILIALALAATTDELEVEQYELLQTVHNAITDSLEVIGRHGG